METWKGQVHAHTAAQLLRVQNSCNWYSAIKSHPPSRHSIHKTNVPPLIALTTQLAALCKHRKSSRNKFTGSRNGKWLDAMTEEPSVNRRKTTNIRAVGSAIACAQCEVNLWNIRSAAMMSIKAGEIKRRQGWVKSSSLLELWKYLFSNGKNPYSCKIFLLVCNSDLDTGGNDYQRNIWRLFRLLFLLREVWVQSIQPTAGQNLVVHLTHGKKVNI